MRVYVYIYICIYVHSYLSNMTHTHTHMHVYSHLYLHVQGVRARERDAHTYMQTTPHDLCGKYYTNVCMHNRIDLSSIGLCCSVLQCVAVCCSVLQRVAVCCMHSGIDLSFLLPRLFRERELLQLNHRSLLPLLH